MLKTSNKGWASLVEAIRTPDEGSEPDVAFVKEWARLDDSHPDVELAESVVLEVIDLAEQETGTLFSKQIVTATYDSFAHETRLPFGPVEEILSVCRLDRNQRHPITGWYDRGDYIYFESIYGYEHPYYRQGLEVKYKAGMGEVPLGLQLAIRQAMLTDFEDRQDNALGSAARIYSNSRRKFMKYRRF